MSLLTVALKEEIEKSLANVKELHVFLYARFRGKKSVQEQVFMTTTC